MPIQAYFCGVCLTEGHIPYDKDADVFSVIRAIDRDHKSLSPECPNDVKFIRVRGIPCTDAEWQELVGNKAN
jgi:hypothetical protein